MGYYDENALASLRVKVDSHGKMPDVLVYIRIAIGYCLLSQ